MQTQGTQEILDREAVEQMIAAALGRPEGIEGKVVEALTQLDHVIPLVEAYGPKFVEKCGPAYRAILRATVKEMMPEIRPIIKEEAQILVSEFFKELRVFAAEEAAKKA